MFDRRLGLGLGRGNGRTLGRRLQCHRFPRRFQRLRLVSLPALLRESLPANVRNLVVFGEGLWTARQPNVTFYPLACERRLYYFFDVEPGSQVVYRPPLLSVRAPTP